MKEKKKVQQCAQCFRKTSKLQFEPFCSERCEEIYTAYAPIELIHEAYEMVKEERYDH